MDVNDRVLQRLERIEALDQSAAPVAELLAELRLLVGEAEEWAGSEGDGRALEAVAKLRGKAGGMG
ncbi:MAG TPA: hypothetical protein VGH52_00280 [Gaiellaceae bacterium]|jgi:hypothetical protein